MRTDNSIKNSITSMIGYVIKIVIGFVSQTLFIKILSIEYLGLNGLFTNILYMLSFFELGFGSAIIYNLYKPVAENNTEVVKSLMKFYKKIYNIVAIAITMVGILIIPFLTKIVGEVSVDINIYVIYLLFLFQTVSSYLISYKKSLIYAHQKSYIINNVHMGCLIFFNFLRLLLLYLTKNYYLYLLISTFAQLIENIIGHVIANKLYPYLLDKNVKKLDTNIEKDIFKKVKALFFHKIGTVIINGTDNIIISMFLGVAQVGLYSNYNLIITYIFNFLSNIITSTTASVGNLLALKEEEKFFDVFKKLRFINFWLSTFTGTAILVIVQPFIKLWIGEGYILSIFVVIVLILNYYQRTTRITYVTFKDSAGIWYEDRFIPILEAVINIVASIVLLKLFGLAGVFMGTIVSSLILWCYSYPKLVYKKLFKRNYINYVLETFGYLFLFIVLAGVSLGLSLIIRVDNVFLQLVINTVISAIVPNVILFMIFRKTDNYKYFKVLILNILNKFKLKVFVSRKKEKITNEN